MGKWFDGSRSALIACALCGCQFDSSAGPPPTTRLIVPANAIAAPTGADLTGFPLLVRTTIPDLVGAARENITFRPAPNGPALPYDLEQFDTATGAITAWVRMPALSAETDTELFVDRYRPSPESPSLTWSQGFLAVWHLGSVPIAGDSSPSASDGTAHDSMGDASVVSGQIGPGILFDGNDDRIDVPAFDLGDTFTISTWLRLDSGSVDQIQTVFVNGDGGSSQDGFRLFINRFNTGNRAIIFEAGNGSSGSSVATDSGIAPNDTWAHLAVVVDRTGGAAAIYFNGAPLPVTGRLVTDFASDSSLTIGNMKGQFSFTGTLDELRLSAAARSPGWIATAYANQLAPESFVELAE